MDQLFFEMTRNIFSLDNLDRLREQQGNERTILTLKNYYRALSEINALVAHLPSSHELFDRTCEILNGSEESSIVGIGLLNERAGLLDRKHFTGPDSGWVSNLRLRVGSVVSDGQPPKTMSQKVFLAGKPLVVNDYMRELPENSLKPIFREHGIRSAAIYPFFRNGTLTGVLAVVSRKTGFFGQELSDLLDGVSRSLPLPSTSGTGRGPLPAGGAGAFSVSPRSPHRTSQPKTLLRSTGTGPSLHHSP